MNSPPFRLLIPMLFTGLLAGSLPWIWSSSPSKPGTRHSRHTGTDEFEQIALPFLQTYCIRCHQGEDAEAGLDLSRYKDQASVNDDLEAWEEIMEALDDEYMPPSDEKQPESGELQQLKNWYLQSLTDAGQSGAVIPHMRRLNRIEYENTIGDLLRIEGDLFTNASRVLLVDDYFNPSSRKMPRYVLAMSHFSYIQKRPSMLAGLPDVPSDPPVEHGFSNDHTALSFSTLQTERYFEIANSILHAETFPRLTGLWESMFMPRDIDQSSEQQKQTAHDRLKIFLRRAFRRPVTPPEVQRYSTLFNREFDRTGSHAEAMKATVSAVLVSPSFLFRQDFSQGSFDDHSVDPWAMASRLSYFLWASMPDDELFQAAQEGRLSTRSGLLREVQRMMQDKKVKSLATDFGMQWLQLASVHSARPDQDLFPDFYHSKTNTPAISMMIEQLLFFETVMIEDRNIMEFVDADWGYINRNLMDWYSLDPKAVLGFTPDRESFEDFFRVKWSNRHKGGVITAGATLLSTSATTRTSPVYRGTWIMDVIFNRPPPAPPANVPALEDIKEIAGEPLNVRQRLARHREDPNCAVCHDRIDPLGFALEKFDAVGRFRREYPNGKKIDAKGTLFDEEFDGAARFKAVISRHEREFVQGFTEHMLKYALGRRLELSDEKKVQTIIDNVMKRGKNFSSVVEEIVLSDLFRSPPADAE